MEKIGEKMTAHFSLKEIVVKKGDKVHITITNTAGDHDFNIDAYAIKSETPLNKPTVIEFIADKVGDFEFYCSKYSHRMIGQTGMLRVIE
jgi:nitrite reductase (NO-forming)